jgi:hypothetical protein
VLKDRPECATLAGDIASRRHARVRAALQAALDAGLHYDCDVDRFVEERCLAHDEAVDVFLGEHELREDVKAAYDAKKAVQDRVAASPRGTWAAFRRRSRDGRVRYQASISDGSGKVALGGSSDSFDAPPTFAHLFRRMREMETYLIRKQLREGRAHAAQMEALATYRFAVGQTFTNVDLGQHGRANRIELTSIDSKTGAIEFNLIKRGSRKRYSGTTNAVALVQNAKIPKPTSPAPAAPGISGMLFDVA